MSHLVSRRAMFCHIYRIALATKNITRMDGAPHQLQLQLPRRQEELHSPQEALSVT